MTNVTIEDLHQKFQYNPTTGAINNKITRRLLIGRFLSIDGAKLIAENCIWAMYYGAWPPPGLIIDHKDRNRRNRCISNLRLATYSQNGFNMASRNEFAKGVTFDASRPSNPWRAQARINGKKTNLGRFKTMEEAAEAYRQAALKYHGEFTCLE